MVFINGEQVRAGKIKKQVPGCFGVETLDVGVEALTRSTKPASTSAPSLS
jgi:hypothetical protein